jgi:hypothetical protein
MLQGPIFRNSLQIVALACQHHHLTRSLKSTVKTSSFSRELGHAVNLLSTVTYPRKIPKFHFRQICARWTRKVLEAQIELGAHKKIQSLKYKNTR